MFKRSLLLFVALVASLVIVSSSLAAPTQGNSSQYKQIAAPPSDFAQLSLPNPAELGVRSRTAMIPVTLAPSGDGRWTWTNKLPVDHGEQVSLLVFAPAGEGWEMTAQLPNGRFATTTSTQAAEFGLAGQTFPAQLYTYKNATAGEWRVTISAVSPKSTQGYLMLSTQSQTQLYTHLSSYNLRVGEQVGLATYAYDAAVDSGSSAPAPLTGVIQQATATFTTPDGSKTAVSMFDDGLHADGAANDGVFGGQLTATAAGQYTAQVSVTGENAGSEFVRTSEHIFPVITPSLSLNSGVIRAVDDGNGRLQFSLRATSLAALPATVQVSAELWGAGPNGTVPVAWVGGLVAPQTSNNGVSLPLSVDGRWLALAGVTGSLQLRNVRVQDVDTHITISSADSISLQTSKLPDNASGPVESITDDMLMGPRPARNAPEMAGVLMLIHGYCSGGTWPLSHFTQYAQFQDYNQNRTHDQFAQLIDTYGDQFSSFGAVAHSQGGAASLHLYTYYWSGLDYSVGSRRIQSVGTPYQGTALAGNLALIGEIFGVGCGTNFDLTYDGSALWLSGIPTWARDDVYFYTTSFKDVWYRYDYCNIASDVFLSDPDDGVIEKWAGQLSSGNNMGHKTGWCHTSGMRDPAQTTDASRNSTMNTYGNR